MADEEAPELPHPAADEIAEAVIDCRREGLRDAEDYAARVIARLDSAGFHIGRASSDDQRNGQRTLPFAPELLGRFAHEAWVRWAQAQPDPDPSWEAAFVDYDELPEQRKAAARAIGEAVARWTLIGDAARVGMRDRFAVVPAASQESGPPPGTDGKPFLARTRKHGWVVVAYDPAWKAYLTRPGRWSVSDEDILDRAQLPAAARS